MKNSQLFTWNIHTYTHQRLYFSFIVENDQTSSSSMIFKQGNHSIRITCLNYSPLYAHTHTSILGVCLRITFVERLHCILQSLSSTTFIVLVQTPKYEYSADFAMSKTPFAIGFRFVAHFHRMLLCFVAINYCLLH